jgi:uncharacterized damage-inducible protein DinB
MLPELEPVWKQFQETYAAVREALAVVPDDRLAWRPAAEATSVARITQHIARANLAYSNSIEGLPRDRRWEIDENAGRELILQRLTESEERVRACLEGITANELRRSRAEEWAPLGPRVAGPLDALWFAQQMVRHSAYHLGQINYIHLLLGL